MQRSAGNYRWRVIAATGDGFDISSLQDSSFTVLPIPPLEKVAFVFPADGETLGVSFFKSNRSIVFRWKKNGEATHYVIRLYNEKKQKIFEREITASAASSRTGGDCTFEFTDLAQLSRGIFYAEAVPERRTARCFKTALFRAAASSSICSNKKKRRARIGISIY